MTRYPNTVEDDIHISILAYLATVIPPGECYFWHPANEGRRSEWEQRKFKERGGKAGIFDICIELPGGRHAYIEVKRPGEKLTPAQEEFRAVLIRFGTPHCVAENIDDVRKALAEWGIVTREVRPKSIQQDKRKRQMLAEARSA